MKTNGNDVVFGADAIARNAADGKYLDTRNTNIATELSNTTNFADMSIASMRKLVQSNLQSRGLDLSNPDSGQTVDAVVSKLRGMQPARSMDDYYNAIAAGYTLGNSIDNPNAVTALKLYNKVQALSIQTPEQIADLMTSGDLLVGSKEYNKLVQSGQSAKVTQANSIAKSNYKNQAKSYILDGLNANPNESLDSQTGEQNKTTSSFPYQTNYEETISNNLFSTSSQSYVDMFVDEVKNNPELIDAKNKGKEILGQINDIDDTLANMQDDIKAQVVATGGVITKGYLAQLTSEKMKPYVRLRESLSDQYSTQMAVVQDLTETANTIFQLKLKEYDDNREIALEQYRHDRDLQDQMKITKQQQDFQTQQADTAWGRQLQLNTITNQQDIEKLKLNQNFTSDQADKQWDRQVSLEQYKAANDSRMQQEKWLMDNGMLQPVMWSDGQVNFQLVDQYRDQYGYAPGLDNPDIAKACSPEGIAGGQCVKYANDVWGRVGSTVKLFTWADQSVQNKIAVTRGQYGSPIPVIGGAVVQDFGLKDKGNGINYGHVAIIIGTTNNGQDLVVSDSNYNQDEKVSVRTIKNYQKDPTIKGYTINPTQQATSGSQTNDAILGKLAIKMFDQGQFDASDLKGLGISSTQFKSMARPLYIQTKQQQYAPSGVSITNPDLLMAGNADQKKTFDTALTQVTAFEQNIKDLQDYFNNNDTSGVELFGWATEDGRYVKQKRENLILQLKELNNLGVLNGNDYTILSKTLPDPTGMKAYLSTVAGLNGRQGFEKQFTTLLDDFANRINAKAQPLGLLYKPGSAASNPYSNTNTTTINQVNPGSYVSKYGFQMPQGWGQ